MTAFDKAFEEVKKLAEQFQNNHAYHTKPPYQEAGYILDISDLLIPFPFQNSELIFDNDLQTRYPNIYS